MKALTYLATLLFAVAAKSAAAQDVLVSNDFENASMCSWTNIGTDAGLYENGDVVSNMGASETNMTFAPGGSFCLWDGNGGSYLKQAAPLPLDTRGYTNITIRFNHNFRNGSGTRKLYTEYSSNSGTTWQSLGYVIYSGAKSYTLKEGTYTFSDQARFRFLFGDQGGGSGPAFIDDIVITATPEWIPPPPDGTVLIVR